MLQRRMLPSRVVHTLLIRPLGVMNLHASSAAASTIVRPDVPESHTVLNQAPPYPNYDAYSSDQTLVEAVNVNGGDWGTPHLSEFGLYVGSRDTRMLAEAANSNGPVLQQFNKTGDRVDVVNFHPSYHALLGSGLEAQVPSFAWRNDKRGSHVIRAALALLQYQAEPGVSCPMSMTFACVPALAGTPSVAEEWIPRVTAARYDPRDFPASEKAGATLGMSMTEKQGGSDVRANTTTATPLTSSTGPGEQYALRGHKWFTSAPMSDAFLTLAQTDEGVSCFLVPRWLPDGTRNTGFKVMRLKDKLGDRSNASSEVEYDNAWGVMLGEPGRGVRTIVEMVVHTRLDCGLGSAGLMRQAVQMATFHAKNRSTFGSALIDHPAMRNVLVDLGLESEAATHMIMRVARSFDTVNHEPDNTAEAGFQRVATAVSKYWICKRAPGLVYEAMECHGGNGFVEEWQMPRLFRQSPLNSIWEGSGNVICLDILRAMSKEPEAVATFLKEVTKNQGADKRLADACTELSGTFGKMQHMTPSEMQAGCRFAVEQMARCLQASVLLEASDPAIAELYFSSRLDPKGAHNYGGSSLEAPPSDVSSLIIERQSV